MKNAIIALLILSILTATAVTALDPIFGADISVKTEGSKILITGTVIDGTDVQLFCNERLAGESLLDEKGAFSIETVYGGIKGCAPGIATLKAGVAQAEVIIPPQFIIVPTGGSSEESSPETFTLFSVSEGAPAHMPEFSLITLGLAVLGAGLGLALLRKH
jgi:hypothetical protein